MAIQITSKKTRRMSIRLADTVQYAENPRKVEAYDSPNLRNDLAQNGQVTPLLVEKMPDGKFVVLRGNRRRFNMIALATQGVIDPKTVKIDEATGAPIPNTGKVFETADADVYEGLTDEERFLLNTDQGNTRTLDRAELFIVMENAFSKHYSEKEIVVILGDLLDQLYPPTRTIVDPLIDGGEDRLAYYRGVLQNMKRAWGSPKVLRDAFYRKLDNKQKWPNNKEVSELQKVFLKEADADKSGKISRTNPGPKFMEAWTKYLSQKQAEEAEGATRPKSQAMMNKDQIVELGNATTSRILKIALWTTTRKISPDVFAKLDGFVTDIESKLTPEQVVILDEIIGSGDEEVAETAPAGAPAA